MQTICFSGQVHFGSPNKKAKTEDLEFHKVLPLILENRPDIMQGQIDEYLKTPRGSSEAIDRTSLIDVFRRATPGTIPLRLSSGQPVLSEAIRKNRYPLFKQCIKDMDGNFPDPKPNANEEKLTPLQKKLISQQIELHRVGEQAVRQAIGRENIPALTYLLEKNAKITPDHYKDAAYFGNPKTLDHLIQLYQQEKPATELEQDNFNTLKKLAVDQQSFVQRIKPQPQQQKQASFLSWIDQLHTKLNTHHRREDKQKIRKTVFAYEKADLDFNAPYEDMLALNEMCLIDSPQGIRALIEAGADIHSVDLNGEAPLHVSAQFGKPESVQTLIKAGADMNQTAVLDRTPIILSAINNNVPALEALLAAGADVNKADEDGSTAAHHAAQKGNVETLKVLRDAKADLNKKNDDGDTPAHCAAQEGHIEILKVLCDAKANLNKQNKDGDTPADLAAEYDRKEALALLQQHGAQFNTFKPGKN